MSGILPANTTLQLSNNSGDITHQGVLGSNASGSTLLTGTFPTTSTGTSLGHYHYTESTTNSLKFLNASGLGGGGHQFWHSSSTEAPIKTMETNRIGVITSTNFSVDKSIQGGTTLVDLPSIIVGTLTQVVFNFPPGLDSFGIQFGVYDNPVQVLFDAGVFTTGTTYYAQATNAQTLVIRATTNPSDPPLDCSVFTNGQIPFAYVSGSTPSSLQTAVLSDVLTITTEADVSVLSATDLTFNGVSVIQPILDANLVVYSTGTTIEGNPDFQHKNNTGVISVNQDLNFTSAYPIGIECAFNENTYTTALLAQNKDSQDTSSVSILLTNDIGTDSAYYGGLTMYSSNSNPQYSQFASMKNALILNTQSSSIVISAWNGQQHGTEAEDANIMLTYSGGSKAHIFNNNGQLIVGADNPDFSGGTYGGDNGGTDSVLTSDGTNGLKWVPTVGLLGVGEDNQVLTYTDGNCGWADLPINPEIAELKIKQINSLQVYNSSSVYQDGKPPIAVPTTIGNSFGQFGWYFKNSFTSGNKINWYQAADIGMKVSDVIGLYMRYFNCGSIGVNDIPYIAIYTKTDTITPNAASWYKSRLVLVPNFIPSANTSYTTQYKFSTTPDASHYNSTLNQMIYSTVGTNPTGAFAPTELINFFAISTSSSSSMNASEFIFQKLGIQTTQGTTEFLYQTLL